MNGLHFRKSYFNSEKARRLQREIENGFNKKKVLQTGNKTTLIGAATAYLHLKS